METTPTALSAKDWEKISALLPRLYRELNPERQAEEMLKVINELVPGECLAFEHFNPEKRSTYTISLPPNFATPEDVEWIHRYNHQSPIASYFSAVPDPEWKTITDFMPLEDFWATEFHRLGLARVNVHHQMLGLLAHVPPIVYILSINRTTKAFTERDRAVLNTIHPHLATSFLNAQEFSRNTHTLAQLQATMETVPGAHGYFTKDRKLAWLQPRAREWLAGFFLDESRTTEGLPKSVVQLVEAATEGALHVEQRNGTHRLTTSLLPSVLGGWILRLERHLLKPPALFSPLAQLSTRENEVLQLMVQGKRNAEIAAQLGLSTRTVEKHVARILEALHSENRASAIVTALQLAAQEAISSPRG